METRKSRYSRGRQKSCSRCAVAKTKCDRLPKGCSRCVQRKQSCVYLRGQIDPVALKSGFPGEARRKRHMLAKAIDASTKAKHVEALSSTQMKSSVNANLTGRPATSQSSILAYISLNNEELCCPIRAEDISNRWLHSYVPMPDQKVKKYPATITKLMDRVFKSYVNMPSHGHGYPPFIHRAQLLGLSEHNPLVLCFQTLENGASYLGRTGKEILDSLQHRMNELYRQHQDFTGSVALASFQAYLLYVMAMIYWCESVPPQDLRQAAMRLQEVACHCCRQGLVCRLEEQGYQPSWAAWVTAEAKRRTLYSMYLFDNILASRDNQPTYVGTELQGLPAPGPKSLWSAETADLWATAFQRIATADRKLRIEELWPLPEDSQGGEILERRSRVDRWLEGVDEYGMLLYVITSQTHQELPADQLG